MSTLLTWSEVDTAIQNRMANQAPSETKRLEAINDILQDINNKYDIETTKRSVSISVIPTGKTAYNLATLVTAGDVKRVCDVRYPTTDEKTAQYEFDFVDPDKLYRDAIDSVSINQYATYWEDNVHYLKVMNAEGIDTAHTFTLVYYSYFTAINGSNVFVENVAADSNYKIALPKRFKELIVSGTLINLWAMALGDDSQVEVAKANNKLKSELLRLGLDGVGHKSKTKIRKVKMREMW
jgi:hypothetical protein